ncbi:MAG: DUF4239 domain-containing protein [Ignavibacteria bacterium]|jgi:hypothetical protein
MINLIIFPLFLELILLVAVSFLITFIGFLIFRKKLTHERLSENHTVASYIFNAFSLSFSVLLAFMVYANWYNYEKAQGNVTNETAYLSNFYRDTRVLPDSLRNIVSEKIINYTKAVIDDEWEKLSKGKTSPVAESALNDLWLTYTQIPVSQIMNPYIYQVSLDKLNLISQYRRLRILDMQQTTPNIIWVVLSFCFSVSVCYTYFFTTRTRKTHLILIFTFVAINILIFYLIYVLDHPYAGYSSITSEPFKLLLEKFIQGK